MLDPGGVVAKYDATTGAAINSTFIPTTTIGLSANTPFGMTVSGGHLFVAYNNSSHTSTIGEYDATTGAAIRAPIDTGMTNLEGIAVSGANVYVTAWLSGTVAEFNIATGTAVNPALLTGLAHPTGIAAYGSNLFVAIGGNGAGTGMIGEYDAATGAAVNAALVTGLNGPVGLAVVPEPSGLILAAFGIAGVAIWSLRKRKC